jgi:hypothetical protein
MKKLFLYIVAVLFILKTVMLTSCANIIPPAGGPRDSLPPVLLKANPPDRTVNFPGDRITFTFDEFVDLDNYTQNLVVSPYPQGILPVTRKLNVVTVKFPDSLERNTTYTLDFGPSIKDINESNVLKNFVYTFSTGRYIDSMEFTGNIILAQTGETDSTMAAALFREKDDSAVSNINKRPRYISKTDGKGVFHFKNLAPGTYYLYAMKEGGGYRYSAKELFAFADSAVIIGRETKPVTLYAYIPEKPAATTSSSSTAPPAAAGGGRNNRPSSADKRLRFATNLKGGRQDLLEQFMFTFDTRLRSFDSSKIHLSTDTSFIPVTGNYSWKLDSTRKILTLNNTWKENTSYNIIIEKDFATDTLGQQLLKMDTLKFTTMSASDYGKLNIRFRKLDLSKNPVLQVVQSGQVVHSYPLSGDTFSLDMITPGEYELRILNDTNKNGVWDPGEFFGKHKQPELVKPVSRKLNIKAKWDNTFEIDL